MPSVLDYIKLYESTCNEIETKLMDIVQEADITSETEIDDEAKKRTRAEKFKDAVKKLLEHIVAVIEKAFLTISNSLHKFYMTDKGFKKQLYDATKNHKPRNVKLIMYQYVDEALNAQYAKMKSIITELISKISVNNMENLKNENNVLNKNRKELETYILSRLGCPNDVTDMTLYFVYVKKLFRGNKKETIIQQEQIDYYKRLVDGYPVLKRELVRSKSVILDLAKVMRSKLADIAASTTVPDDVKAKVIQQARNVSFVYNMYSSFVGIMYQLKLEQMISARIVLQKVYQF